MKKSLIVFILAVFAIGFSFAQEAEIASADTENAENKIALEYAEYLFEDGFVKGNNAKKIAGLSPFLTPAQRENLYEENEKSGVAPFLLNLLLGFGIGSFSQGDTTIGYLQLWGDIVGYGLMIPGMIITQKAAEDLETSPAGTTLVTLGSLITLGVAIPAYIRAWTFTAHTNKKMRQALQVDENGKAVSASEKKNSLSVSFAPIIQPISDEYGLMARISF